MTKETKPKTTGRPSKYRAEMCEQIIELGEAGKLPAQVAATLGVTKQTLHEWKGVHEAFSYAYAIYKEKAEDWWLNLAQSQAGGGVGNFNATKFMLAAAFRYTEKTEVITDPEVSDNKMETVTINYVRPKS